MNVFFEFAEEGVALMTVTALWASVTDKISINLVSGFLRESHEEDKKSGGFSSFYRRIEIVLYTWKT
jgi:hypothetical protein